MAKYLGNRPTPVPLTSSDLEDSIITSAKILDGTIVNADVNDLASSKLTGALPAISGASLTSLPAGNLTGTVADARISTLTSSKLSGALPAISGASLTNLPGGGKILQVTQGTSASSTSHSTISTYTASAISGTITPSATSSKVFVLCWFLVSIARNPSNVAGGYFKLYKDVGGGGYSALWPAAVGLPYTLTTNTNTEMGKRGFQSISYLDSPSTTSAITYKLYGAAGPSGYGNLTTSPDSTSASVIMFEVDGS